MKDNHRTTHGGQLRAIAELHGLPMSDYIDFSANINPDGPPHSVVEALRSALDTPATLTSYPDLEESKLRQSIASHIGLELEDVAVANGYVPLLEAAIRACGIKHCVLPVPCFSEYQNVLSRCSVQVTPVLLKPEDHFAYDLTLLLSVDADAILLANPQNPSGVLCPMQKLLELTTQAENRGIRVFLDEAFIDYVPQHSLVSLTSRFHNLIVFRSVTKFYAIPGLRVAYAVANPLVIRELGTTLPPWSVTTLASLGAQAALSDTVYAERAVEHNYLRRCHLQEGLQALGLKTYPGAANFLLMQLPLHCNATDLLQRLIDRHHLVMRSCSDYNGLPSNHIRVAVRSDDENGRLLRALAHELE